MEPKGPGSKGGFEKEPEVIEINQIDTWKTIKPGQIGVAAELGNCFGIIVYDPVSKYAVVGHLVSPKDTRHFQIMLDEAKKLFKNMNKVKTYVGGNTLLSENAPDFKDDYENRKFLENALQENSFPVIKIKYANLIESTDMSIDTRTGAVEYKTYDELEDKLSEDDEEK